MSDTELPVGEQNEVHAASEAIVNEIAKESTATPQELGDKLVADAKANKKKVPKYNVSKEGRVFFKNDEMYLPVTFDQFEDLTNELLAAMNMLTAPHYLSADYMAQVLTSAIHALKGDDGLIKKSALFKSCVKRISMHITFDANTEIQDRIKAEAAKAGETVGTLPADQLQPNQETAPQEELPPEPAPQ